MIFLLISSRARATRIAQSSPMILPSWIDKGRSRVQMAVKAGIIHMLQIRYFFHSLILPTGPGSRGALYIKPMAVLRISAKFHLEARSRMISHCPIEISDRSYVLLVELIWLLKSICRETHGLYNTRRKSANSPLL